MFRNGFQQCIPACRGNFAKCGETSVLNSTLKTLSAIASRAERACICAMAMELPNIDISRW